MINKLLLLIKEIWIVYKILPLPLFFRWFSALLNSLKTIIQQKSLGSVDSEFGESFDVSWNDQKLHFDKLGFGVVREIYGHKCYAQKDELKEALQILDLGANAGAFTVFALAEAPNAKITSVEAQPQFIEVLKNNIEQNGFGDRAVVECAVVGGFYNDFTNSLHTLYPAVKEFDIHQYISRVKQCDFLKCDVEGGEFPFFEGDLSWMRSVRKMVLEYHPDQGNVDELENKLRQQGFQIKKVDHSCLGYFYCQRI
jgi:FkbM family methyltransferase